MLFRSSMGFGSPGQPGQVMSPITRDLLAVTPEQRKRLDEIQKQVDARLDKLLTADQRKQFTKRPENPGPGGIGPASRAGQIMADPEQKRLKLTDEQKKALAALQKDVDDKFDQVLNAAQKKQLKSASAPGGPPPGGAGPGGGLQPGKILSPPQQDTLKLSPEQKKKLEDIQKEVDAKLDKLLTEEQKKQLRAMQQGPARGGPGGPGGPGRGGPPGGTPLFRAYRYAANYPGFAGKKLTPGKILEELQPKEPAKKEPEKKN